MAWWGGLSPDGLDGGVTRDFSTFLIFTLPPLRVDAFNPLRLARGSVACRTTVLAWGVVSTNASSPRGAFAGSAVERKENSKRQMDEVQRTGLLFFMTGFDDALSARVSLSNLPFLIPS